MKLSKLRKLSLITILGGVIALTGCDPESPSSQSPTESDQQTLVETPPTDSSETPATSPLEASPDGETAQTPASPKANADTMKVEVYHADSQCSELVSESVSIPETNALEATVGNVIESTKTSNLEIAGYQVNVDQDTGVATVDMSLDPDSQRQFVSLSSCEKFALFGSLNETLTANEQWNIEDVRFTESGEEILF